jgi:hypothetical protein
VITPRTPHKFSRAKKRKTMKREGVTSGFLQLFHGYTINNPRSTRLFIINSLIVEVFSRRVLSLSARVYCKCARVCHESAQYLFLLTPSISLYIFIYLFEKKEKKGNEGRNGAEFKCARVKLVSFFLLRGLALTKTPNPRNLAHDQFNLKQRLTSSEQEVRECACLFTRRGILCR